MSWVRCWHHSMRHLQWCLWWTVIWVGMRDEATLAQPSSVWGAIPSWHNGSFFWDPMMTFTIMEKFVRIFILWICCFCLPTRWLEQWLFDHSRSWFRKVMRSVSKTSPILPLWLYDDPLDGWSSECCRCLKHLEAMSAMWQWGGNWWLLLPSPCSRV